MADPNKDPSGQTPSDKGGAQGPKDTPKDSDGQQKPKDEKLLSGKYKTEEERDKAFLEGQRTVTEATEKAQRAEDLLNAYLVGGGQGTPPANPNNPPPPTSQGTPPGTPVSDYSNLLANPGDVLKQMKEDTKREVLDEVSGLQNRLKVQEETKILFYTKNPTLVGNEIIVTHFANEIGRTSPNLSLDRAMEEVAKRSLAYVGKLRDSGKEPPAALGGGDGGSGRPSPDEPEPKPKKLTPEETLNEEIANRRAARK